MQVSALAHRRCLAQRMGYFCCWHPPPAVSRHHFRPASLTGLLPQGHRPCPVVTVVVVVPMGGAVCYMLALARRTEVEEKISTGRPVFQDLLRLTQTAEPWPVRPSPVMLSIATNH
ncbi:hypothetical protein BaRGS_00005738 [Batillaria attramentaria]|uniref:Uncharacterized protein n=1 Tax=Batillaria attramentaria TaxID=370345 RepID=A0ABD0LVW9_9CAEN